MKPPTQKELIERWENVLRVLRALTPHQRKKHWDMGGFIEKTDCGTVCCAAGHCAFDPWFRKHGWKATELRLCFNNEVIGFMVDDVDIHLYFGEEGSKDIFHNFKRRPVGQVIREVRAHIKELKAAA